MKIPRELWPTRSQSNSVDESETRCDGDDDNVSR